MPEWFNTPLIIIATMAVGTGLIKFGQWMDSVNSDRSEFKEFMQEIRNDIKEIRASITEVFARLPASPITGEGPLNITDLQSLPRSPRRVRSGATAWRRGPALKLSRQNRSEIN